MSEETADWGKWLRIVGGRALSLSTRCWSSDTSALSLEAWWRRSFQESLPAAEQTIHCGPALEVRLMPRRLFVVVFSPADVGEAVTAVYRLPHDRQAPTSLARALEGALDWLLTPPA